MSCDRVLAVLSHPFEVQPYSGVKKWKWEKCMKKHTAKMKSNNFALPLITQRAFVSFLLYLILQFGFEAKSIHKDSHVLILTFSRCLFASQKENARCCSSDEVLLLFALLTLKKKTSNAASQFFFFKSQGKCIF